MKIFNKEKRKIESKKLGIISNYKLLDRYPVVFAEKIKGSDAVGFYCKYCKFTHTHHFLGNGFRVSHCSSEKSPLYEVTYFLVYFYEYEMNLSDDIRGRMAFLIQDNKRHTLDRIVKEKLK